jgi:hypothetical protein
MDIVAAVRERLRSKTTDMDELARPRLLRPGDPRDFADDERTLGFAVPELLKRLYAEIGNGGFGPGYGLIGLRNGFRSTGQTASEIYAALRSGDAKELGWSWPWALLPICDWGCAIMSCIDCSESTFRMRIFDPNAREPDGDWGACLFDDLIDFDEWIEAWASGVSLWDRAYGDAGHFSQLLKPRHPDLA